MRHLGRNLDFWIETVLVLLVIGLVVLMALIWWFGLDDVLNGMASESVGHRLAVETVRCR